MPLLISPTSSSSSISELTVATSGSAFFGRNMCAALNSPQLLLTSSSNISEFSEKNTIEISVVISSSSSFSHEDRDLIRRNIDTATTALHPSVDPRGVEVEFSSSSSSTSNNNNNKNNNFSIFIDKSLISPNYVQYSICGRCFYFPQLDDFEAILVPKEFEIEKPEKLLKAIHKNRIGKEGNKHQNDNDEPEISLIQQQQQRQQTKSKKEIWNEACEMTRLIFPMRGNSDVILEPNGVSLMNVRVVGMCSRFLYFGAREYNDENFFHVIGFAPHANLYLDADQQHSYYQKEVFTSRTLPLRLVGLNFLENYSNSLPRPMREISWINDDTSSTTTIINAQLVSYRALIVKDPKFSHFASKKSSKQKKNENNNNKEENDEDDENEDDDGKWIKKLQLEDSYVVKLVASSDNNNNNNQNQNQSQSSSETTTIYALRRLLAILHRHTTLESKGRGGMSTILSALSKNYLKRFCDPKMNFSFTDKRDLNRERKNIDGLFRKVMGSKVAHGGDVMSNDFSVKMLLTNSKNTNNNSDSNNASSSSLDQPDETQQVEFKQQLHQFNNNTNNNNGSTTTSKANVERARRIISAFANTRGGMLLVGVNDDGVLVGVEGNYDQVNIGEILPRSTGFIPAMIANSVSTMKLKFPQKQQEGENASSTSSVVAAPKPALDWWKKKPNGGTTTTTTTTTSSSRLSTQHTENNKAVYAMSVMKGAAPFYCTPGPSAPAVRGQGSTLLLAVTCMTERLMAELTKFYELESGVRRNRQEGEE